MRYEGFYIEMQVWATVKVSQKRFGQMKHFE